MAPGSLNTVIQHLRKLVDGDGAEELPDGELLRRFAAGRDEAAFTLLVRRLGPMVFGVCRRVLRHAQDAEDAFQATFLALARQAAGIGKREAVGGWLYRVAYRIAMKAKRNAARRAAREAQVEHAEAAVADADPAWRDLRPVLDQELNALPEKLRAPLVLCYLQGKTYSAAARELGWTTGTLSGRMAQARQLLKKRLARRGLALSVELLGVVLAAGAASAAVPPALQRSAVQGALTACGVSLQAVKLADWVARALFLSRVKMMAGLTVALSLLMLAALAARAVWPVQGAGSRPPGQKNQPRQGERGPQVSQDGPAAQLPPGALKRLGTLQWRHGGRVTAVAVAPDGKAVVSVAGSIRLWNPETGEELAHFGKLQLGEYRAVAFSTDGKKLVTVGPGCQVWDPATGKELCRLRDDPGDIQTAAFFPDGKTLATLSGWGRGLLFWDAATGERTSPRVGNPQRVQAFALSPRGNLLATVERPSLADRIGRKGAWSIHLLDPASGKQVGGLPGHTADVSFLAFSPDGKYLVSGGQDGTTRLWDVVARRELCRLGPAGRVITSACFAHGGHLLATLSGSNDSSYGTELKLWEVPGGRERLTFTGRMDGGRSLAFSPDGKTLFTAGAPHATVRLWNVAQGEERPSPSGHQGRVVALACSPDGKLLASAGTDRTVRIWDLTRGKQFPPLVHPAQAYEPDEGIHAVAFSPDGKLLASAGEDRVVRLWDMRGGLQPRELKGHRSNITCLAFSPDGQTLLSGGKTIRRWDVGTGRPLQRLHAFNGKEPRVLSLAFAPDGKTFASTAQGLESRGNFGNVLLWDAATGQVVRTLEGSPKLITRQVVFSPDGKTPATIHGEQQAGLWDVQTGRPLLRLVPRLDQGARAPALSCLAFAPDGKTLAAGTWEGNVLLFDPASGKERRRLGAHRGAVLSLAFTPDGKRLASGSTDTTILIWDVSTPQ